MNFQCIDKYEAKTLLQNNNAYLIDVRDKQSFDLGHIEEAIYITEKNMDEFLKNADFAKPLIVCCYHGNMSKNVAAYFHQKGFQQTYSLNGGYEEWDK